MKNLIQSGLRPALTFAFAISLFTFCNSAIADGAKESLTLKLPEATLKGTPEDLPTNSPNMEPIAEKPVVLQVPQGTQNIAAGKTVTSSTTPFNGELSKITDGKKEPVDDDAVEFKKGVQWVQVDLGAPSEIFAIAMWHDHRYLQVMHCVVVQVSDDPEFKTGVTTLFNNDIENTAGLGAGKDRQYLETRYGKVIDAKGIKARYVRGYTKGSSQGAINAWEEIEVYGLPAK